MANKSINTLDNTSTLDNADLLVLWKASANAAYNISGQDFTTMLTALASGHGGISNIAYTAPVPPSLDGTLTITLADGTSSSFTVSNGAQGPQGDQTYVWIAYANASPTSDADVSVIPGPWIGFYVGLESTQVNLHYTDYTWYEFKGPAGEGVAYTTQTIIEGGILYTMYTASGIVCGNFTVYNGTGNVDTVNGIAPVNGDVSVAVGSVEDLELNGTPLVSGSATIADAYAALQVKQMLVCHATEFTSTELPMYNGNRVNDGTIEIVKGSGTDGWIELHGRQSGAGDWRMFFTALDAPTGTWIRSDIVSENGTPSATDGTLVTGSNVRRSGNTVVLTYGATGVDVPTTLKKIGTIPSRFAPSSTAFGIGVIGFGSGVCYADVTNDGDIRIRGNTAQSGVAVRFNITWIQ